MKKEKYYKDNKLNVGAIVTACVLFSLAVGFVLYSHVKYVMDAKHEPTEPVKTYTVISEEEGVDRLTEISEYYTTNLSMEDGLDVSVEFDNVLHEDGADVNYKGYFINREKDLDANFFIKASGENEDGEQMCQEIYFVNNGTTAYDIQREKVGAFGSWNFTKYETYNFSTKQEAYDKASSGLSYALLLIFTAGPAVANSAEGFLEGRLDESIVMEKFETTGECGNLKYTVVSRDEEDSETTFLYVEYNNFLCTHFSYNIVGESGIEGNFVWNDNIKTNPIPRNK